MVLYPFHPILAWMIYSATKKPINFFLSILLIPIAMYFIIDSNRKLPRYLIYFIIFTLYHLCSAFINDTIPKDTTKLYFILTDPNVLAVLFFIAVENTNFDGRFMDKMSNRIFVIVLVSLVVSLIQIKIPTFFFNTNTDEDLLYIGESRNFSIYSWTGLNSLGITFPILVSILLSTYELKRPALPLVALCGIVVSFLTRTRYVMLSMIVVLSQLFFNTKTSIKKRVSLVLMFAAGIFLIVAVGYNMGYDINEVINTRVLEKNSDMASAKARVLSYEVFLVVFPDSPWFGVGPETRKDVIDLLGGEAPIIHVGYLSYLYFYGIVGCLPLFLAVFFLLRNAWMIGNRYNFWGSYYGLLAFCVANITMVYFNFSEMGIVLAVIYLRYFNHKSSLILNDQIPLREEPEDNIKIEIQNQ
ncbi:O-antigen ligase family protein [Chryseolinea sp. H1M3-3]|uniref:O-antigen ligase family protein n=1 Tax=Chryseolinea sp. H1M3-3 TaxID=3034144 RepID=UPI0023ED3880|nr:O-antigen ligase family protein [Chryseolinea sp. H1M3-3]